MTHATGRSPVILVVGGTSFIATHLLPTLAASGATVAATYRGRHHGDATGVRWVAGDLSCERDAKAWPERCDGVIYLAQSRGWREFPDGAADVFAVNIDGVFRALEYARHAGASHFVFVSSGSVYPAQLTAVRESDPIDIRSPRSFYAASKIAAEVLVRAYGELFTTIVVRLFVPFGPGQSADMLLPRIAKAVRSGQPVTLQGDCGLIMNPVAVTDVAEGLTRCLAVEGGTTLNLAGPEVVNLRDVAERIGRAVGREPQFNIQPGPSPSIVGDISALREQLAWSPSLGFDDGLRVWLGAADGR